MPRQASVAPSVAGVNVGNAGQMAVPNQHPMAAPSAVSTHGRSAVTSDPRGNMLYVQQVLQQVQHNPDPRLIENLAETLHRSKVENLEQELHAQYANNARLMQEQFNFALAEERSSFQKEAGNVITNLEHGTEVNETRLREELNLAYMAQATSTQNATNADHKLAQVYSEAQSYIHEMKQQSAQHNALMESEVQASKQMFEIQKAKISSQTQEIAEQRLLVEKQAGELREQRHSMSEQRELFQEQTECTRKLMADLNSLKEEMEHLKSKNVAGDVRKETPLTEGRMPVPEGVPNFSSFPVGESKPSNEQQNRPKPDDPFQHDDPWKKYKPSNGPEGIPTSFGDDLFGEPKQNTTSPDPGLPHANASGGNAATGNPAESLLRELISALGSNSSNRVPHGSKVKEAETLRFPEFPTPEKYRSWRTAVREEVRAASDRPDEAWTWLLKVYEEREDKKNHMAELGNPAEFVTLDTKILAQLSKVARGELARQILTFKDVEAQNKRVVRGRQVLLMFEQYFKTNEEAGALYGTEDLLQVRLQSDDLKSFLQNWDAVIAGMKRIPDENTLKDLFLRQLRKSRRMGYDLDVYDRSSDGSHHRSYAYLVQAVRDLLARERLKLNRDRISKSNDMRYSTAASGEHSDNSIRRSPSPRRSPGNPNRGRKAHASMAVSANINMKSLGTGHIPPEVGGRAQGVRSTPHGVGVARLGPLIGQTSRKFLAGFSRKDIAGEATAAHSNMKQRHPQQLPQHVSVQDLHRPSQRVIEGNAVTEVRGVGKVAEVIAKADVVAERVGRENHHPEARVLKTALAHHAFTMHVLSSKMTTGKCPKAEMWLLDTISTTEMSCSIHVAPSVHIQPACCLILGEQDIIKKIMKTHVSKTIGDSTTLTNPLTAGRGRQSFA